MPSIDSGAAEFWCLRNHRHDRREDAVACDGLGGPRPPHPTCIETTTAADPYRRTWVCGPDCPTPIGPDAGRDARRRVRAIEERNRASRALDRFIESLYFYGPALPADRAAASASLMEAVGDYVLARIGDTPSETHHNRHYGVPTLPANYWRLRMRRDDDAPKVVCDPPCCPCAADGACACAVEPDPCAGGRCPDPEAHAEGAHDV